MLRKVPRLNRYIWIILPSRVSFSLRSLPAAIASVAACLRRGWDAAADGNSNRAKLCCSTMAGGLQRPSSYQPTNVLRAVLSMQSGCITFLPDARGTVFPSAVSATIWKRVLNLVVVRSFVSMPRSNKIFMIIVWLLRRLSIATQCRTFASISVRRIVTRLEFPRLTFAKSS